MNRPPDTHSKLIGYLLWIFGFTGAHRFYYGKPLTGTLWFFTCGLFLIGWIVDLFLILHEFCRLMHGDARTIGGLDDYIH